MGEGLWRRSLAVIAAGLAAAACGDLQSGSRQSLGGASGSPGLYPDAGGGPGAKVDPGSDGGHPAPPDAGNSGADAGATQDAGSETLDAGTADAGDYLREVAANPIPGENQLPGDPNWPIQEEANDHEIEGYASDVSAEAGQTVDVAVSLSVPGAYTWTLYRMGWYGGAGARRIADGGPLQGATQPSCPIDPTTALMECQWSPSFSLTVARSWVSGYYLIKLHRSADGYERYVPLVVRDHRAAELVMKVATNTDEAYNGWGGESLYQDNAGITASGMAYKVSYDRPYDEGEGAMFYYYWERHLVRWLEQNGYDVTYGTNVDVARFSNFYGGIGSIVTGGHDEYWSQVERDDLDAALASGTSSIVNLTANEDYWRVRYEPDSQGTPFRRVVCYKDEQALDPDLDAGSTALFRSDPDDDAENAVFGAMYEDWELFGYPLVISDVSHPFFQNTGFKPGDTVPGLVGYEYDSLFANGLAPQNLAVLANSPLINAEGVPASSQMVTYVAPSGRTVFSAGSIYYPTALATDPSLEDVRIWKLTWNILEASLAHRHAPRPTPAYAGEQVLADPAPIGAWASSVVTIAGTPQVSGYVDGPARAAQFAGPDGIAVGSDGTIYVADTAANRIRAISTSGQVTTLAGNGQPGDIDGPGSTAEFRWPEGLAIAQDGSLIVADSDNHQIRRVGLDPDHTVVTLAGAVTRVGGFQDGPGPSAMFNRPVGIAVQSDGSFLVVDEENSKIRKVANDGAYTVTTVAGVGVGYQDGPALQAAFDYPTAIALDPGGTAYICDSGNQYLRRLANGVVDTIAGNGIGFQDGTGDTAMFRAQMGLVWTPRGLVVADSGSNHLRRVAPGKDAPSTLVTTLAGSGVVGFSDGTGATADLEVPGGIAVTPGGKILVVDTGNDVIRQVSF